MFGIGFGEMVVIAVLILIAVGPDKLPTMVKTVAKTYRQFRRAANEIRASTGIDDLLRDEELRELAELRKQKLLAMSQKPAPPKPVAPAASAVAAPVSSGTVPSSSTVPAKPMVSAHAPPPPLDEEPVAPVPAVASSPGARGLTYKQRTMEMPLDGVDLSEIQHGLTSKPAIPETRAEKPIDTDAATLAAIKAKA
ncbi:Sec-independent protein translocase protein TatB [Sandaracinus amylolyticus]|uniref:Sec-independent protein translocase protein TatB n=1 Tax=Sandaracinus amylolyticus TaxID=927083 RepID=UPI001F1A2ABD|nr:Sec-independent protein translocase protein TatB [Sandaracinus amylolyticus]UJR84806.1 Hypothetical protein I5071_68850 [Sandaracinus amylolyticus]